VLFVMILRTDAMEFRSKEPSPRWRSFWDTVFAIASTGLAFLLGVAFGDVLSGVPMDADGNMSVSLIGLLKPVPLLVGVTTVAMFAMHGSLYLVQKTEGELQARIRRAVPRLIAAFFVLNTVVVVAMVMFRQQITARYVDDIWPVIFPAAALVAILMAYRFVRQGREFAAFLASSVTVALLVISGAVGMFPNLIISTTDSAYNLTIYNAASADSTLIVCLIVAVIGIPFILAYTAGVYYFFRGKTTVDSHGY
jgi:cytochrome d ubiquinol oxidase subunit II